MFKKIFGGKNEYKKLEKTVNNYPIVPQDASPDKVIQAISEQTAIMGQIEAAARASKITGDQAMQLKRTLAAKMPQYVHDLARNMAMRRKS